MTSSRLIVVAAALTMSAAVLGQNAVLGQYDLTWHKIAGGGATFSTGGGFALGGTIGQHDAGTMSGGGFDLAGGFWAVVTSDCIDADLNCDGVIDGADLAVLLSEWGQCTDCRDCPADLDNDCEVTGADLANLLAHWS